MDFKTKNILRFFFSLYSYALNILEFITNLMPPFIRDVVLKLFLKKMGSNVYIDYGVYFRFFSKIEIGNEVTIGRGTKFFPSYHSKDSYIKIGNNVRIAPDVLFLAAGHDYNYIDLPDTGGSIIISDNVWIGARVTILQGVTIGVGSVIAAGSIVTKDIESYKIAAGTPARILKDRIIHDRD